MSRFVKTGAGRDRCVSDGSTTNAEGDTFTNHKTSTTSDAILPSQTSELVRAGDVDCTTRTHLYSVSPPNSATHGRDAKADSTTFTRIQQENEKSEIAEEVKYRHLFQSMKMMEKESVVEGVLFTTVENVILSDTMNPRLEFFSTKYKKAMKRMRRWIKRNWKVFSRIMSGGDREPCLILILETCSSGNILMKVAEVSVKIGEGADHAVPFTEERKNALELEIRAHLKPSASDLMTLDEYGKRRDRNVEHIPLRIGLKVIVGEDPRFTFLLTATAHHSKLSKKSGLLLYIKKMREGLWQRLPQCWRHFLRWLFGWSGSYPYNNPRMKL